MVRLRAHFNICRSSYSISAILVAFFLVYLNSSGARAQEISFTFADIKSISPQASDEYIKEFIRAQADLRAAGINNRLRMAHFLTQVMTETGGMRRIDENMNYSFKSLMRVFSRKTISEAKAREIAGKPQLIANWVYGSRLGNRGRDTQDGWNYRGSGFIQLTGRTNFRVRGREIGQPLEESPELARQAREGLQAAIGYWKGRGISAAADDNDHRRVRILVNGPAAHGLDQSKVWFARAWTRVFRNKPAAGGVEAGEELVAMEAMEETALFDSILEDSGLLSEGFESDGGADEKRAAAIKAFQAEVGLEASGVLDEATQIELLDPREWRYQDDVPVQPDQELDGSVALSLGDGGTEAAEAAPVEPEAGTGTVAADPNLDAEDLSALDTAKGIYADYEKGGPGADPDRFVPFSVIEPDTRVAVNDTTGFPARAIAQILLEDDRGSQRLCTGTMISPDTVLTAGHCIHSGSVAGQPFRNFRVIPGRNRGAAPFGRCKGRQAFVLAGWTASPTLEESRYYDLGAIKLDCQVGNATGWVGVRAIGNDEVGKPTLVQGYAGDLAPTGRQWVSEDRLRVLWQLKGFYQNDTFGGTSGAPVFEPDSRDVIIGVHTNGLHSDEEPWKSNNAFTRITPERLARIQEWIAHD